VPKLRVSFYIDSNRPVGEMTRALDKALLLSELPELRAYGCGEGVRFRLAEYCDDYSGRVDEEEGGRG